MSKPSEVYSRAADGVRAREAGIGGEGAGGREGLERVSGESSHSLLGRVSNCLGSGWFLGRCWLGPGFATPPLEFLVLLISPSDHTRDGASALVLIVAGLCTTDI